MSEYLLEMRNINISFYGMQALKNASLKVKKGTVHALLGINGAGKSTMIKILSGVYNKDSGEIYIDRQKVQINNAQDAFNNGVSTVYQYPELVKTFTGYENIYLGDELKFDSEKRTISRTSLKEKAERLAKEYGIDIDVSKQVSEMKPVEQELVCILKALSREAKILILDEPTSILTEKEKISLFETVKELKKRDIAIIFITHRLDEVLQICDEITIYRDGITRATLEINEQLKTSEIAEMMLGRKLEHVYPPKSDMEPGEKVLEVNGLNFGMRLTDVNFYARKGEVLGIFGLVGSGIDELSKIIFGAVQKTSGNIYINGEKVDFRSPSEAIKNHVFLVPGDKLTEGIIGRQSIKNNITLSAMKKVSRKALGLIKGKKQKEDAVKMIEALNIATTDENKFVEDLSGGNQQKVVVGKGLYTNADVYLFCEPTIGVDVGAKAGIYDIMRSLSKKSVVILLSSDIEEAYGMSDRLIVLNQGRISMEKMASDTSLNEMLVHAASES